MSVDFVFCMESHGFVEDMDNSKHNGYGNHKKPITCWERGGEVCYELHLTKGKSTIISASDLELVCAHNWHADKTTHGYRVKTKAKVDGKYKSLYMHRLILGESDMVCDHIRDEFRESFELDNRRSNLRLATQSQDQHNRLLNENACVVWNEDRLRYQVMVGLNSKYYYQPTFTVMSYGTKSSALFIATQCERVFRGILHNNKSYIDDSLYVNLTPTVANILRDKARILHNKMNTGAQ